MYEKENQEREYELTPFGILLSAVCGLAAEGFILFMFHLDLRYIPFFVLLFLWLLSGIIVSGVLLGFAELRRYAAVLWRMRHDYAFHAG